MTIPNTVANWRGMDVDHVARLTREERLAAGKVARSAAPRSSHGEWRPANDRPDPVALLQAQDVNRFAELLPLRYGRMLASPFTFFRATAVLMAQDLAHTPVSGFETQICGDAHIGNFGVFASAERQLVFDINDFDETLPGPWEWDLKRLAASLVVGGRENGLPDEFIRDLILDTASAYRAKLWEFSEYPILDLWYDQVNMTGVLNEMKPAVRARFQTALSKAQKRGHLEAAGKLTEGVNGQRRFKEMPPTLMHVSIKGEDATIREAFNRYRETLPYERRMLLDRYRFVDFAMKVVGVASVATGCFVFLLDGGDDQDPLILQLKEANASVLEAHLKPSAFSNHGQRVVVGQRLMQATGDIFLGWLHNDANGRDYYVRQLRDMKYTADFTQRSALRWQFYLRLCAWALARAHARTGDAAMLAGYVGKRDVWDQALVKFGFAYADQSARDYEALQAAVRAGRIQAAAPETD